jgi:hypothetical protein
MILHHGIQAAFLDEDAETLRNSVISSTGSVSDFGALNSSLKLLNSSLNQQTASKWISSVGSGSLFISALSQSVAACKSITETGSTYVTSPTYGAASSQTVFGCCLLPSGNIFAVPYNGTTAKVYYPATDTTASFVGAYAGSSGYISAVVMPDGRAFAIPYSATAGRIFDETNSTSSATSVSWPGSSAFAGGVLFCLSGSYKIYLQGFGSTTSRIYHIQQDSSSIPNGTFPANSYRSCVLLPNGNILRVPYNAPSASIYNPNLNSSSFVPGTYPGSSAYVTGVLTADGKVFCIPYSATKGRIFDPVNNTSSILSPTFPGSSAYLGGCLMPDGKVLMTPSNQTKPGIYDPATDTYTTSSTIWHSATFAYGGATMMRDGRIFCCPLNERKARIWTEQRVNQLDTFTLSSYLNKL